MNTTLDTTNSGLLSLRDAISAVNAGSDASLPIAEQAQISGALDASNTITFNLPSPGTITLGSVLVLSNTNSTTTITGPGETALTISGGGTTSVFTVDTSVTANITGLTISNAHGAGSGGIDNLGTLSVTNSTFSGNTAIGGGIDNQGTLTITNSTLSGNTANLGGGVAIVIDERGLPSTLTNVTITGNRATTRGGGVYVNSNGPVSTLLQNTIVAGNFQGTGTTADDISGSPIEVGTATADSHVEVFDGKTGALLLSFFAFPDFMGGVTVGSGDVTGAGHADVIVGTATGSSHVKVFDGTTGLLMQSFMAFAGYLGGVNVAGGDVDGDGVAEILVGANANGHVKVFNGSTGAEQLSFIAYPGFDGAVRVGSVGVPIF